MATSLTQAEYTSLDTNWVEFALGAWRYLIRVRNLFRDSRHIIFAVAKDTTARQNTYLSDWTLVGYKRGVNSAEDGSLFVDVTDENPGAGSALVDVYDEDGGTLVASGSAANGATVTLAEQNNSGLSGTVLLGTVAANIEVFLFIEGPFQDRAHDVDSDVADRDEAALLNTMKTEVGVAYTSNILPQLNAAVAAAKALSDLFIMTVIKDKINGSANNIVTNAHTQNPDGSITLEQSGVLLEYKEQRARAAAAIQYFEDSAAAVGAVAQADAAQQGDATFTDDTVDELIRPTQITFRCNKALDASGNETFVVSQAGYKGEPSLTGRAILTMGAQWKDAFIGLIGTLTRDETDDHGGADLSAWSFTGLTSSFIDSANDKIYASIATVATTSTLKLYSALAMTDETQIAQGTGTTGAGAFTIAFTSVNGSTISGSVTSTDPPADDTAFEITLNSFEVDEAMTVTPTNDEAGEFQAFLGRMYGMQFGTNAAHTIADAILKDTFDSLDRSGE